MMSKWMRNVLLFCIAVATISIPARAQDVITAEVSGDAEWLTLQNKYITFVLGVSGTVKIGNVVWNITGRWHTRNIAGDPESTQDDGFPTIFSVLDSEGFVVPDSLIPIGLPDSEHGTIKIKIDNNPPVIIDNRTGQWSKAPKLYNPPAPGKGLGKTGPFIEGEWTVDGAGKAVIKVKVHISLVRDTVRFEFTLMNGGAVGQVPSVGFGLFGDINLNKVNTIGTPFMPGIGVVSTTGTAADWYPKVLSSSEIPETLSCMDSVEDPTIGVRNILSSQDCTAPDYFTYGEWGDISGDEVWLPDDYRPQDVWPPIAGSNLAFLAIWKQTGLSAGSSRKIVTYWGTDAASTSWTKRSSSRVTPDSGCLAIEGPKAIKYDSSNLPSSYGDPLYPSTGALSNPAFQIKAYVYNLDVDPGPYDLNNVQLYLYLPPGLALNGSDASQEITSVPTNMESAPVVWDVIADGSRCGELEYYVSARADSGWQQVVRRKIYVPAIKNNGVFKYGTYQMVSAPFGADDSSVGRMFQWKDAGVQMYSKYWDPTGYGSYVNVDKLVPGQGFWAFVSKYPTTVTGSPAVFSMPIDSFILGESSGRQDQELSIDLKQKWNMIGDPFVYPIYLGQLYVHEKTSDDTLTFDDALARNWISRTIFTWNSDKKTYDYLRTNDQMMYPWKGYWIYARVPVKLFFRPATFPGTTVTSKVGGG